MDWHVWVGDSAEVLPPGYQYHDVERLWVGVGSRSWVPVGVGSRVSSQDLRLKFKRCTDIIKTPY